MDVKLPGLVDMGSHFGIVSIQLHGVRVYDTRDGEPITARLWRLLLA